jgi:hypothetical protein
MDKCISVMPDKTIPYNFFMTPIAECYYRAAQYQRATVMMQKAKKDTVEVPDALSSLKDQENDWVVCEEKGGAILKRLAEIYGDDLDYYLGLEGEYAKGANTETQRAMSVMQRLVQIAKMYKQSELSEELTTQFNPLQQRYSQWTNVNR